jgi:hypothetical protein
MYGIWRLFGSIRDKIKGPQLYLLIKAAKSLTFQRLQMKEDSDSIVEFEGLAD